MIAHDLVQNHSVHRAELGGAGRDVGKPKRSRVGLTLLVVRHSLEFRLNPLAVLAIATVFVVRTGAIAQAANPKIKL